MFRCFRDSSAESDWDSTPCQETWGSNTVHIPIQRRVKYAGISGRWLLRRADASPTRLPQDCLAFASPFRGTDLESGLVISENMYRGLRLKPSFHVDPCDRFVPPRGGIP